MSDHHTVATMDYRRYALISLVTAALVYNIVAQDESLLKCRHNGHEYDNGSTWASTVPGECSMLKCHVEFGVTALHYTISGSGCGTYAVIPKPYEYCSDVHNPDALFPDCCPRTVCVNKTTEN